MRTAINHRLKKLEQQEANLARNRIKSFVFGTMTGDEHNQWKAEISARLIDERGPQAIEMLKLSKTSQSLTRPAADRLIEHLRLWIESHRDGESVAERWEKCIGPIEAKPDNQ